MAYSKLATWKWSGTTNHYNIRDHKIDKITIHHMAGNGTLAGCCNSLQAREGSCNYCIDSNGNIGVMIDERYRAWTSSNRENDMRAVTIEVANAPGAGEPDWKVTDKALSACIALCVDICKRNGISKLNYTGNKNGNLTMHKWFAATGCPGNYLSGKFPYIASQVNKKLGSGSSDDNTVTPTTPTTPTTNLITYDAFEKKYLGKAVDYDGVYGVQCVDLFDQYIKEVFGITGVWCNGAKDLYKKFNSYPALVKNFTRIANTRELVVKKGDVVIWGGGSWGHVGICTGKGNIDWFETIEENTLGKHEKTQKVTHYYNKKTGVDSCSPVLGVLRPKDQTRVSTPSTPTTFKPYLAKVTADVLNIRKGAGTNYAIVGTIKKGEVYTIVKESGSWGFLKSGAGWISLNYVKKV